MNRGLEGVRVLEVADLVAAPYAAKLLADLGAEVIKVESPAGDQSRRRGPFPADAPGDPEQSGLFLGLNTNKSSRVLDLDSDEGKRELADLVAEADIVIHSLSASHAAEVGLAGPQLLAAHPSLVVAAITPFGHTGPQAEWRAEEINLVQGGGWGYLIPGDGEDPEQPPLTVFGHPASCQAGMAAAFAALAAWDKADRTGVGEFIDMASMAQVAAMLEASFIAWSYMGEIPGRVGGRILTPWKILPCRDGLIFLVTVEADQWDRLVEMMGNPEWALMEVFSTFEARSENQDLMYVFLAEWTEQFTVEELFHDGQARRICFAPVFTMRQLAGQAHLAERGFFAEVAHAAAGERTHLGSPWLGTPSLWSLRSGAPQLGSHVGGFAPRPESERPPAVAGAETSRPLEGVRVIDFSWVWAGPFCTMHLAYLGAEVIKIESAARPGLGRRLPIHADGVQESLNTCGYFNQWDQGKKSVEIDLTSPEGLEQVLALIKTADVAVDNYATGVLDRLGLGDEVMRAANPNLIMASVTGYGHTGPLRQYMGYGPTTAPLSGLTALTGHVGGRPEEAGLSFGDPAAGLAAAFAVCAALTHRRRTGEPSRVDTSLWEATAVNAIEAWMGYSLGNEIAGPMGNRNMTEAPHGVFRATGDDEWVSIACTSDEQWQALASLIGTGAATKLEADARFATAAERKVNEDELEAIVTAYTEQHDKWQLTEALQAIGVAAYPSLDVAEVEKNPQLEARDFWARFEHPEVGVRTHSGVPWRTTNAPSTVTTRAPLLGEHSEELLDNM